jgi:hypothetical protein
VLVSTRKSESGFISKTSLYEAKNCTGCPLKCLCHKAKGNRRIEINHKLNEYRKKAQKSQKYLPKATKSNSFGKICNYFCYRIFRFSTKKYQPRILSEKVSFGGVKENEGCPLFGQPLRD